ncbi:hypothetical protein [Variovorax boronicumulans]|uniref:hypothetical protein n=1 Tax=Variovorax boronicumulans TaxID=436515 RepID=UPI0033993137
MNEIFLNSSRIGRQLYGVACLEAFVKKFDIEHPSINALLLHLRALEGSDFTTWEREGASLSLNGRGDMPPADLLKNLPKGLEQDFLSLVDSVVEIGIVEAYGEESALPLNFLQKAVEILSSHKVPLPDFRAR